MNQKLLKFPKGRIQVLNIEGPVPLHVQSFHSLRPLKGPV